MEDDGGPDVLDRVLRAHRRRLEARPARVRGDLHRVTHLLEDLEDDTVDAPAGAALPDPTAPPAAPVTAGDEKRLAAELFNGVWALMETEDRTPAQDDRMLHMAHASRFHWEQVGHPGQPGARGVALLPRLRRPPPSGAVPAPCPSRAGDLQEHGIADWDLAFAHEALARAHAVAGDPAAAREEAREARAVAIADDEDRKLLLDDLRSLPGGQEDADSPRR